MDKMTWAQCLTSALLVLGVVTLESRAEEPLLLTAYLRNNDIATARRLSQVDGRQLFTNVNLPPSYAGYLTVNDTLGNHMFFWFFPSTNTTCDTPLLLWLNGGPTVSSMLGLFWEHGPVRCVSRDGNEVKENEFSWVNFAAVLYIDNPVGTGYSFSEKGQQGVTFRQEDITRELYNFLQQFYVMFPEYRTRDFYIGGQSYAGKYVPSLAHFIHHKKSRQETDIPLTGVYLGGPLYDPPTQLPEFADYLYSVGVVSYATYSKSKAEARAFIKSTDTNPVGTQLLPVLRRYFNVQGIVYKDNYVHQDYAAYTCVDSVMTSDPIRRAVHAGTSQVYNVLGASEFYAKFGDEFFQGTKAKLAELMDHYKVLIFTGDYDVVVSSAMTEAALLTTPWSLQLDYNTTERSVWWGDQGARGFYSVTGEFCRVVVRAAGHQTPYDQPEASSLMMQMFITDGCVHNNHDRDETPFFDE